MDTQQFIPGLRDKSEINDAEKYKTFAIRCHNAPFMHA
jgi:hypothetical protein